MTFGGALGVEDINVGLSRTHERNASVGLPADKQVESPVKNIKE